MPTCKHNRDEPFPNLCLPLLCALCSEVVCSPDGLAFLFKCSPGPTSLPSSPTDASDLDQRHILHIDS